MEAFDSGTNLSWSQRDPTAEDLKGLWAHSYQLWRSREFKKAQDVMLAIQASALPTDEIPAPQTPNPAPMTPDQTTKKGAISKGIRLG